MSGYLEHEGKKYCTEPYRTVCIGTTGGVTPCCALSNTNFGLVTEDTANSIQEIYDSKEWKRFFKKNASGNFDNVCKQACNHPGITTFKLSWKIAERENWKLRDKNAVSADIAFGNLCNLSCTMCSSVFSSEWIKIEKKENGKSNYKPWNFSEKQVKEIAEYIKDVTRVVIKGGEPMFNPRLPLFLKELAKYKTQRDFTLISNLSVIQEDSLKQLEKFQLDTTCACINASIESCDNDYYKLIRGGKDSSFDQYIQNFNLIQNNYKKINLRAHYLLNAWNMHQVKDDIEKLLDNGVRKIQMDTIIGPVEQSFLTQNLQKRQKLKKDLENIANKYPSNIFENKDEILTALNNKQVYKDKSSNIYKSKVHYDRRLLQGVNFTKTYEQLFGDYINAHA